MIVNDVIKDDFILEDDGQVASGTYCRIKKLNKEDYGVEKYWVRLAVVKE